ncbi:MAG: UDP-3-O-(3-hydroxymyristoyl)glucosamine N-acyltransferase [Vulcanimicrobiaceae bacterium]
MPTLGQLAHQVAGSVHGEPETEITRIAAVGDAGSGTLTFATDERYFQEALRSKAAAILVDQALIAGQSEFSKPLLVVASARIALSVLLKNFERPIPSGAFRHPSAVIDPSAQIGADVYIGALVCIGAQAVIGARSTLQTASIIADGARIGESCILHARATVLEEAVLGDRVVIHSGAVVGSEGFGWAFLEGRLQKIPQIGNVVLGDDVEIGANTCIDRAQTGSTRIGNGTKIDNLCQIGHNCEIGEHTALAAQCGLAGTTIVGSYTQVGGQAGFKGHITIGSRAKIGAGSAVWGDVPDDGFVSGRPARPHKEELRREVMVRKLPKLFARVDALESQSRGGGDP